MFVGYLTWLQDGINVFLLVTLIQLRKMPVFFWYHPNKAESYRKLSYHLRISILIFVLPTTACWNDEKERDRFQA